MISLVSCGDRLSKTTMFYSMIVNPSEYYIRLENDNEFVNSIGLNGYYSISGEQVTFTDAIGGKSVGYLIDDEHLLYIAYDGNDTKIPDESTFDASVFDGTRTTISFKSDGTMEKYIYQENIYNFQVLGTYERDGQFIHCTFTSRDGIETVQTYGVREGVLYEVFCSDTSEFTEAEIASISALKFKTDEEISTLAVVIIVVMLILIFAVIFLLIFKLQKIRDKGITDKNGNRDKISDSSQHNGKKNSNRNK